MLSRFRRQTLGMRIAIAFCAVSLTLSAALVSRKALADGEDQYLKGDALQAEIAKNCADGCITFIREEAEKFQVQLDMLLGKRQKESFEAVVRYQQQACASLVSR